MHQHMKLAECESTHVPCVCRCVPTCKGAWDSLGRGEDKAPNNIPIQTWLLDVGALSPQGAWSPGLIHVALSQVWAEHCAPPWPWPPHPQGWGTTGFNSPSSAGRRETSAGSGPSGLTWGPGALRVQGPSLGCALESPGCCAPTEATLLARQVHAAGMSPPAPQ